MLKLTFDSACYNSHINNSASFCGFRLSLGGQYSIRLTAYPIIWSWPAKRLVKVSWQAWPIFGPTSGGQCRPIVGQTFLLFLARLCQFWPRPAAACPGHADLIYVFCFSFSILALANHGQARLGWPCGRGFHGFFIPWSTWPKHDHKPGSPRLSGRALTPVYPGLAGFLMQGHMYALRPFQFRWVHLLVTNISE